MEILPGRVSDLVYLENGNWEIFMTNDYTEIVFKAILDYQNLRNQ